MAKPFSYRYPLQEANGNYGTLINPDDHSASRYVELRGSKLAALVLDDVAKNTIEEWEDTYDLEGQFPKVLPSKGIWLGVNGCISIGSGMSCSIPPTNLREVNQVLINLINNPNLSDDECVCLPDFPTGGVIINANETKESMKNGTGFACKIRAVVEWDKVERCFIVREMPYSTFTNTICSELAFLMEKNDRSGIIDFKDYTGANPDLRIYLSKTANPEKVLKMLYKETSLETFFSINMVLLDNGQIPRIFTWKDMLLAHIEHEKIVYRKGFEFDLNKIRLRLHIIDGILIAIHNIDTVIKIIQTSESKVSAALLLKQTYLLDDSQVDAILEMKLARLANLEVHQLEEERKELTSRRQKLEHILSDEKLFNQQLIDGWNKTIDIFGDERRTQIMNVDVDEEHETVEEKQISLTITNFGNIYSTEISSLYTQRRNTAGIKMRLADGEYAVDTINCSTFSTLLVFNKKGQYKALHCGDLTIGEPFYIGLDDVLLMTACENKNKYLVFITKKGYIKKSLMSEYRVNKSVISAAIKLEDDDEIVRVLAMNEENVGIMTQKGHFIWIKTDEINPIGRISRGIIGIKLNINDCVAEARVMPRNINYIVSVDIEGYIKKSTISEFNISGRATKGTIIQKTENQMVSFLPILDETKILIQAADRQLCLSVDEIVATSRNTMGVKTIKSKSNIIGISTF